MVPDGWSEAETLIVQNMREAIKKVEEDHACNTKKIVKLREDFSKEAVKVRSEFTEKLDEKLDPINKKLGKLEVAMAEQKKTVALYAGFVAAFISGVAFLMKVMGW